MFGGSCHSLKVLFVKCVPGETPLLCALFYLKCSHFSLLLAVALLPYCTSYAYLVRRSCMFCLTCSASLAGTAFFSVCRSIFIFPCSGLNHMWFLLYLGYTLLDYAYFMCITLQNDLGLVQGMIWGMFQRLVQVLVQRMVWEMVLGMVWE